MPWSEGVKTTFCSSPRERIYIAGIGNKNTPPDFLTVFVLLPAAHKTFGARPGVSGQMSGVPASGKFLTHNASVNAGCKREAFTNGKNHGW